MAFPPTGIVAGDSTRLCLDCSRLDDAASGGAVCAGCGGSRFRVHAELASLSVATLDLDAFYATVEHRDRPELDGQALIVGGAGGRGVVTTCDYECRKFGVHSAMPMWQARKLCPQAVIIPPDMAKYKRESIRIHTLMLTATPMVEMASIDEAFLELSGTTLLHGMPPAGTLARLQRRIHQETGITASIGLSHNRLLAKIASNLDKPNGFFVIGKAEAEAFLEPKPVSIFPGVGEVLTGKLARDRIVTVADLKRVEPAMLMKRYGAWGERLAAFARGEDAREIAPDRRGKSIGAERTFETDLSTVADLEAMLWPLCEKVARRLKEAGYAANGLTLKLKTAKFENRTRACNLSDPTQLAEAIWRAARPVLAREATGTAYRLIGISASGLVGADRADPVNLADPDAGRRAKLEQAMDSVRAKYGLEAIKKGRGGIVR